MKTQKEIVDEIVRCWKSGDKNQARFLVKTFKKSLSPKVYDYLYEKTEINKNNRIPKVLLSAQRIIGGTIYDQYGEVSSPLHERIEFKPTKI